MQGLATLMPILGKGCPAPLLYESSTCRKKDKACSVGSGEFLQTSEVIQHQTSTATLLLYHEASPDVSFSCNDMGRVRANKPAAGAAAATAGAGGHAIWQPPVQLHIGRQPHRHAQGCRLLLMEWVPR